MPYLIMQFSAEPPASRPKFIVLAGAIAPGVYTSEALFESNEPQRS